jgi:hypothetical protein
MKKRLLYALIALALVFFVTSLIIYLNNRPKDEQPEAPPQDIQAETDAETTEPQLIKLKVFYYTEGSQYMMPLTYELETRPIREELIRSYLQLILRGEEKYIKPIPEGVQLRAFYFEAQKGMLVVDFSEELLNNFPSGTQAELEFIYYIVDNLCFNFEEIKMVKILVSGNEYQTLAGHIDISNPFFPDYSFVRDI